ncbi:MAG: 50S ribosomal protein L30 [uncultured bacterium]|nr:MAG: 50S ribosomal protein L30 [uncultured bacterium]OGT16840.1 MAG: 50S ribosomal protein L30 [Gammaproteobacteria bacterium RIFCSPHIGHO2_02_FULL_38_33]OGT23914.1 MAG: 50S ribosomal protein L30 [Gammaproteobacteria bacterium RIFCSPHIGHO2_12_38_15]OGT67118.1 MAG: 50S ribosomal protein L30 [Gammaproteobacteria bacterium RIFCSPLOWO2_02_FULL_38_11]OGT76113.1 MAG: 50S ribosomal protein L30 [Gammaproteobacteria bacterium RIFCSPLOWO2_12_FULL_38_14]
MKKKKVALKQTRSEAGCLPKHKATLRGLGLRGLNHEVEIEDTACTRGMISQVSYLLKVKEL